MNWDRSTPEDAELRLVRPYALTAGRTRPVVANLAIEAIVVAEPAASLVGVRHERLAILQQCARPTALAEIAARMKTPLGAVRVLVADLLVEGLVSVHQPVLDGRSSLDVALLERVLAGLQAL